MLSAALLSWLLASVGVRDDGKIGGAFDAATAFGLRLK
jgi:hypothetical protein